MADIVKMPVHSYTWIFVVGMLFAFMDAYSIGANDVANSFATSVGSRSITLSQAVGIAIFTEFGGALALGAETTGTVKDSIISTSSFKNRPDLLMMGFLCALVSSSSWVMFATYLGWPVSTTHTIIGSLIGVGISSFGFGSVNWGWDKKGVSQIVTSWFLAPLLAGVVAAGVYLLTLHLVMKSKNSLKRGIWAIPFYFTITVFIVSFYVVTKNGKSTLKFESSYIGGPMTVKGNVSLAFAAIGAITGAVLLLCVGFLVPYFIRRLVNEESLKWYHIFLIHCIPEQPKDPLIEQWLKRSFTPHLLSEDDKRALGMAVDPENGKKIADEDLPPQTVGQKIYSFLKSKTYDVIVMDVATVQHVNKGAIDAHDCAIIYDNKTEYLYSLLQVVTAAFASFAHGSNDVANALGPLAGIFQIWESGTFLTASGKAEASVPIWMLAYAGFGIDCGLALYGYKIMRNLGNNLTYHSPSRGFCMELGAALAVITASFLALPVSTTQCIVGATVAVGLCNGQLRSINWSMVGWCFFSWFLTLPCAALCSGLLLAIVTRGPSFTLPPGI